MQVQRLVSRQVDGLPLASTEDDPNPHQRERGARGWSCSTVPGATADSPAPEGLSREASRVAVEHLDLAWASSHRVGLGHREA
jgi:hypothetical protein